VVKFPDEASVALFIRASVAPEMAEVTTTRLGYSFFVSQIILTADFIATGEPTELPPYFMTNI
jgi:hypothetical protein